MNSHDVLSAVLLPLFAGGIAGFFIGLLTGIIATLKWVARRRERGAAVPVYTDETNPTPGKTPWRSHEHFSKLGWVFVVLGVLGLLLGSISLYQNNTTADCLRDYINQASVTNQERSTAGDLDRMAIRQQIAVFREFNGLLINSITNPPNGDDAREKARADYLAKAGDWDTRLAEVDRLFAEAEKQREANPVPASPDC